ncbi:MAG: tetratricopeptide repeat protein, partial [Promethearchaeota archaeon]
MDLARKYHISEKTVKLLQKGLDYCNLGRYSVGLSYMEKALKRDPNSAFVLNHVGMTYMSMGRFEDALNSFKRAVEIDPANLDYLYNLARAYSKSKRYETAYKTYLKYIEQASYHIRDINEIGIEILGMCEKMGNFTYAVEYWLKAVKIDPEIDKFWMNLSAAFLFNRDYNEAIASIVYYNYAFGPKTRDYEGFLNLVNIYIELKDFVKAQKL